MKYTRIFNIIGVIVVSLLPTENWAAEKNGSAITSNGSHHRAEDTPKLYKFFRTPILFDDMRNVSYYHDLYCNKTYNWGVVGFGASDFLSYAAHFCKYDADEDGAIEVVSVGSGDGTIEKDICEMHEKLFGTKLNITLVNKDPQFVNVHYKTVKDLIKNRPDIVGNCALLLIWPDKTKEENGYDIEAVRKLQPRALLTLYDKYLFSGSRDFRKWLRSRSHKEYKDEYNDTKRPKLKKYKLEEMVDQPVYMNPGPRTNNGTTYEVGPGELIFQLSIMRLKRKGLKAIKVCRSNVTTG